jgi:hypothetical protein
MKNSNPKIKLATAIPLVSCAAGCAGLTAAAGKLAPHPLQKAAASSFAFVQAGQTFIVAS